MVEARLDFGRDTPVERTSACFGAFAQGLQHPRWLFVLPNGDAWGRPVSVTVASDGSLLFTDDGSNSIWRVSYKGK